MDINDDDDFVRVERRPTISIEEGDTAPDNRRPTIEIKTIGSTGIFDSVDDALGFLRSIEKERTERYKNLKS